MTSATFPQRKFLEILFGDLQFNRGNAWLTREAGRPISYLDEITTQEASRFIEALKARKDELRDSERVEEPEF